MSTMRSGLETWLKQECVATIDTMLQITRYLERESREIMDNDIPQAIKLHELVANKINSDAPAFNQERRINELMQRLSDGYQSNNFESIPQANDASELAKRAQKFGLEKLVECQCGKHESYDITATTRKGTPEHYPYRGLSGEYDWQGNRRFGPVGGV